VAYISTEAEAKVESTPQAPEPVKNEATQVIDPQFFAQLSHCVQSLLGINLRIK